MKQLYFGLLGIILIILKSSVAVELTFTLLDNAKDCFYEVIHENTSVILEYQVVTGGQYDVDVIIEAPNKEILYQQIKSQFDNYSFVTRHTGDYAFCFSNEFSTFSHKVVYMELQVGEEQPFIQQDHLTVMTLMESASYEIHKKLNRIIDYQTHHRLREATSFKRAEDLNDTVFWWCLTETIVILFTMVSQILILKNFFSDNRHSSNRNYR